METRVTEIAPDTYRLTTVVPDSPVAFNQYLVAADEPTLVHTGMRLLFWLRGRLPGDPGRGSVAARPRRRLQLRIVPPRSR